MVQMMLSIEGKWKKMHQSHTNIRIRRCSFRFVGQMIVVIIDIGKSDWEKMHVFKCTCGESCSKIVEPKDGFRGGNRMLEVNCKGL